MAYTPDLFAPPETGGLLGSFKRAFDSWREAGVAADRLQRESTVQVYEDMWNAFTAWCVGQSPQVTLKNMKEEDLERFLASRVGTNAGELSARHAWRLLNLVDRVLTRHAIDHDLPKNQAAADYLRRSDDIRRANISDRPVIEYLDANEARRLVTYLSNIRPGGIDRRPLTGWQELRNLTAVALHLGAGVTPGDVRALLIDAPVVAGGRWKDVPWKLIVPGNGNRPPRETPVAPWAGQLLRYWLGVRAESRIPRLQGKNTDVFLLPGRSGQQWGKMAHYDAIKKVMEVAGVDDPGTGSGGAFRLRHTFALRQLRKKKSIEDVARWMGIVNLDEMQRYRAVLNSYEEAV